MVWDEGLGRWVGLFEMGGGGVGHQIGQGLKGECLVDCSRFK